MSSETNTPAPFKVFMHPTLVDELDEGFSPMDGIVAISDVFTSLPKAHRSRESKRQSRKRRKTFRIYTARLSWYPLGLSYVQIGQELHVLELWCDDTLGTLDREEVDAVLEESCLEAIQ